MKTEELTTQKLNELHYRATRDAIKENSALGLPYRKIEKGKLVEINKEGHKTVIGEPRFGTVKVKERTYKLKK